MSARAASLLRRVARVAAAPTRCVRHGSSTPAAHDAAHPQSAGAAAYEAQTPHLFGEAPAADGARVREAWEIPFYFTVAGVGAVLLAFFFRPSTNPHDWARDEAEERFRRAAAGLPVVRGVNYAALRFLKEAGSLTEEEALALEEGANTDTRMPRVVSSVAHS